MLTQITLFESYFLVYIIFFCIAYFIIYIMLKLYLICVVFDVFDFRMSFSFN